MCARVCALEFISFITSQAMDNCLLEKRKTLNGEDLLHAMFSLGFEHYSEILKIYLAKYRETKEQDTLHRHLGSRSFYHASGDDMTLADIEFVRPEFDDFYDS